MWQASVPPAVSIDSIGLPSVIDGVWNQKDSIGFYSFKTEKIGNLYGLNGMLGATTILSFRSLCDRSVERRRPMSNRHCLWLLFTCRPVTSDMIRMQRVFLEKIVGLD